MKGNYQFNLFIIATRNKIPGDIYQVERSVDVQRHHQCSRKISF